MRSIILEWKRGDTPGTLALVQTCDGIGNPSKVLIANVSPAPADAGWIVEIVGGRFKQPPTPYRTLRRAASDLQDILRCDWNVGGYRAQFNNGKLVTQLVNEGRRH